MKWIKAAVAAFEPKNDAVILDGCRVVKYDRLVVAPGLKLDWDAVEGLPETQPDVTEEKKGPRVDAPEQAIQGFLKSVGLVQ